jgi:hypothetical protein
MERQPFLGLTAQIDNTLGVKLKPEDKLKIGFEFSLSKGLK